MKRKDHDLSGAGGRSKVVSGLTLKKRPLVDLNEGQMADVAGGHPHTCEPTCPPTCCPTCGDTCAESCGGTCGDSCGDSCGGTCGDSCGGACDPNSTSPDRCI